MAPLISTKRQDGWMDGVYSIKLVYKVRIHVIARYMHGVMNSVWLSYFCIHITM